MTTKDQWIVSIRTGNEKQLRTVRRWLFRNIPATIPYIQALTEVSRDRTLLRNAMMYRLVQEARSAYVGLDQKNTIAVLDAFHPSIRSRWNEIWLFAVPPTNMTNEEAFLYLNKLLDIGNIQTAEFDVANRGHQPSVMYPFVELMNNFVMGGVNTWGKLLNHMERINDAVPLLRLFDLFESMFLEIEVVMLSEFGQNENVLNGKRIRIPAQDAVFGWTKRHLQSHKERMDRYSEPMQSLIGQMRERYIWYFERYEDMWLDMMVQPKWALREDGLDCVLIAIPEFRSFGIQSVRVRTIPDFPSFRASFEVKRMYLGRMIHHYDFSPTDLSSEEMGFDEDSTESDEDRDFVWMWRCFAFVAVYAVWQIVMGVHSREGAHRGNGEGSSSSAVVRARFRHLPQGFNASAEARARALEILRAAPLPGFTFVREYQRGEAPQSSEPLFSITGIDPE